MVSAITAAPNLRARVIRAVAAASPSSKLIEFNDRLAAIELQRRLEHGQLGRVDHQRAVDLAAHPLDHLLHLGHLVAADEGGAHVERVAALAHLLAAHGDAAVPVASRLQLAEFLRAVGVAALADGEERILLAKRDG